MPLGFFRLNGVGRKLAPAFIPVVASGGTTSTITVDGVNYKIHRFTATGNSTFTVTGGGDVDILLVGGGSGGIGPSNGGAGGGAGGVVRKYFNIPVTAQSYTITVGAGGAPNSAGGTSSGLSYSASGGTNQSTYSDYAYTTRSGRYNADYQGGVLLAGWSAGAGGAGAGGNGGNVNSNTPSAGGIGAYDTYFSSSGTYYGGGGGGGAASDGNGGEGGLGGGGRGNNTYNNYGTNGTANTGGGGGGGGGGYSPGAKYGGSGIVIIRYKI